MRAGTSGRTGADTALRSRSVTDLHSTTPPFGDEAQPPLLEAYLLDFDGDLYGEHARVSFVDRLRDELKFDSVDDLIAQMGRDVDATRVLLDEGNGPIRAGLLISPRAGKFPDWTGGRALRARRARPSP